jgi:hypothetical protein
MTLARRYATGSILAAAFACLVVACDGHTSVKGTVRDERGNPVEGALVRLTLVSTKKSREARTGGDGSFVIGIVHAPFAVGKVRLSITKDGFEAYTLDVDGNTSQVANVTLGRELP